MQLILSKTEKNVSIIATMAHIKTLKAAQLHKQYEGNLLYFLSKACILGKKTTLIQIQKKTETKMVLSS